MQKYLSAAEQIAARAVGGDPLPAAGHLHARSRIASGVWRRRHRAEGRSSSTTPSTSSVSTVAAIAARQDRAGHAGDLGGRQAGEDGVACRCRSAPSTSRAARRSAPIDEVRVFLPGNEHTFRAEFVDDEDARRRFRRRRAPERQPATSSPSSSRSPGRSRRPAPHERAEDRRSSAIRRRARSACTRILRTLARRAYRRPVTTVEVAPLTRDRRQGAGRAATRRRRACSSRSPRCWSRRSFLFRIERDPRPGDVGAHQRRRAGVAPQLLPLELDAGRRAAAARREPNRLHLPAVLRRAGQADDRRPEVGGARRQLRRPVARDAQPRRRHARRRRSSRSGAPSCATRCAPRRGCSSTPCCARTVRSRTSSTGKYTFLNERLAKHYGIDGVDGPGLPPRRARDRSAQRRLHAGERADRLELSDADVRRCCAASTCWRTSSTRRRRRRRPTCRRSTRKVSASRGRSAQQIEQHRADPLCACCHTKMDPLGFAPRELRRHRPLAHRRTASSRSIRPATFPERQGASRARPS